MMLLLCVLLASAPSPGDELLGRWVGKEGDLVLNAGGKGAYGERTFTWTLEPTGGLQLVFSDDQVKCSFNPQRDRTWCFAKQHSISASLPFVKASAMPKSAPRTTLPCMHVVEGVSAGPIRLGMKLAALNKLPFTFKREVSTPEWLVGGPFRVQLDRDETVVRVRASAEGDASLCLDDGPPSPAPCRVQLGTGDSMDCPERGVRLSRRLGDLAWVEVFPPRSERMPGPDECTIAVKPGVSVGPLRLGMSRREATQLGLGFREAYPGGSLLSAGPFLITFESTHDSITSIKLALDQLEKSERVCLESQPIETSWTRETLCTRGLCACTISQRPPNPRVAWASCPEGIGFDFTLGAPGKLQALEVTQRAAKR